MKKVALLFTLTVVSLITYSQGVAEYKSYRGALRSSATNWEWEPVKISQPVSIDFYVNSSSDLKSTLDKIVIGNGFNDVFTFPYRAEISTVGGYTFAAYDKEGKNVEIELVMMPVRTNNGGSIKQNRLYIRYHNIEYYYIYVR